MKDKTTVYIVQVAVGDAWKDWIVAPTEDEARRLAGTLFRMVTMRLIRRDEQTIECSADIYGGPYEARNHQHR